MTEPKITKASIRARLAADWVKPGRLPQWEEVEYLLWLLDQQSSPEVCCSWGCGSGACEACPCCAAGWCIGGRDGIPGTPDCEPDATPEQVAEFWRVAVEHNPIAGEVYHLQHLLDGEVTCRRENSAQARKLMDAIRDDPAFPPADDPALFGDRALLVIERLRARLAAATELTAGTFSDGYQPYAVDTGEEVILTVGLDDLRAALEVDS